MRDRLFLILVGLFVLLTIQIQYPVDFNSTVDTISPLGVRYLQMLWIGFSGHAATFSSVPSTSSPFLNSAPALTNATR